MDGYYSRSYSSSSKPSSYWLHSTRKSPWKNNKAPIAPAMAPKAVKVYKVDALNFREVVQKLTGARGSASASVMTQNNNNEQNVLGRDIIAAASPPPSRTTEAFGPLSPPNITNLEPNRVL